MTIRIIPIFLVILAASVAFGGVAYTYDASGHLITANYGNGSVITYTYDQAGNLITRSMQGEATGPMITSVTTASGGPAIAQNTFIVIKGVSLVPTTTPATGVIWSSAPSFASGQMPTQLNSVSVTVNSKPAFVYFYCSAATDSACAQDQLNILTPLDTTTGPVPIVVTSGSVSSTPFTATMQAVAPAFLLFGATEYVAATHANNSLVGPTSLYPGSSTPAIPSETIVLYAVGFGLPATALVNDSSSQTGSLPVLPVCQVGGNAAAVVFAGLNGSPGLYQLNITIPSAAANGDNPISCSYNGSTTPAGALIPVQRNSTSTVLFSNTSSTVPQGSGLIQGASRGMYLADAFGFTPSTTGTFTAALFDVWTLTTNGTDASVTAYLYSSAGNTPGTLITQLGTITAPSFSSLPQLPFSSNHVSFAQTSGAPVRLTAGTQYWLILAPAEANSSLYYAYGSGALVDVPVAQQFSSPNSPWTSSGLANVEFEIDGTN